VKIKRIATLLLVVLAIPAVSCGRTTTTTISAGTTTSPAVISETSNPLYEDLVEGDYKYPEIPRLTCEELKKYLDSGGDAIIIDTRFESSFNNGHLPGAISIPYIVDNPNMEQAMDTKLAALPDGEMKIFYCD
jgi:hypothetical protein